MITIGQRFADERTTGSPLELVLSECSPTFSLRTAVCLSFWHQCTFLPFFLNTNVSFAMHTWPCC